MANFPTVDGLSIKISGRKFSGWMFAPIENAGGDKLGFIWYRPGLDKPWRVRGNRHLNHYKLDSFCLTHALTMVRKRLTAIKVANKLNTGSI